MLTVTIPGTGERVWTYLVLDVNGTITTDGRLAGGVEERLSLLARHLEIRLLTADTRGTAVSLGQRLNTEVVRIDGEDEAEAKRRYVQRLGGEQVIAVGNGRNDALMLRQAGLGIAVLGPEGLAVSALQAADILVREITDALDMLIDPVRLASTLRS